MSTPEHRVEGPHHESLNNDISALAADLFAENAEGTLRDVLSRIPCGIILVDENRIVRWANEYAHRLARCEGGWDAAQTLCGKPCGAYLCPAEQDRCPILDLGETINNSERILRRYDGVEIPILKTVARIQLNGEPILLESFVEITKLKQAELALQRAEQEQKAILDNVGIGIALIDPDMRILSLNKQMRRWFPRVDADQRPTCYRVYNDPPRNEPCSYCPTIKTLRDGRVHQATTETPTPQGNQNFRIVSSPIVDAEGRVVAAIEMVDDITQREQMTARLNQALEEQQAIFESSLVGIMVLENRILTKVNRRMAEMLGYEPEEMVGRGPQQLHLSMDHYHEFGEKYYWRLAEREIVQVEYPLRHKDGQTVWCQFNGRAIAPPDLSRGAVWIIDDITERKRAEARLRTLSQAIDQMATSVVITDSDGIIEYVNPAFTENTGYTAEEAIGQSPRLLKSGHMSDEVYRDMWQTLAAGDTWRGELHNRRKDGSLFWELATIAPIKDDRGVVTHFVAAKEEITRRKSAELELITAARTDKLTGLTNRTGFCEQLEQTLERSRGQAERGFAVLFLDFDRFKIINDSLGHDTGDRLLKEIAKRLREALDCGNAIYPRNHRPLVARFGGDEFVVLLEDIADPEEAIFAADCTLARLACPYELAGYEVYSTASIGIRVGRGRESATVADLLRDADTAMYEAKLAGRGRHTLFDDSMRQRVQRRMSLENDLRKAVDHGELFLLYQPIVSLHTGRIESCEALIRWQHPQHGLIRPGEFVPIAEETGMILEIGEWVLRTACARFMHWRQDMGEQAPPGVSVNLSRNQIARPGLAAEIKRILDETGMVAEALSLEVTEGTVMQDVEQAIGVLTQLKNLGIKLAMDDFGTGHSSLACLHELPFDVLKIDRSFIHGIARSRDFAAMIHAVANLAENLRIQVVAEGIETLEQLTLLQSIDCRFGQGYLFSKPIPPEMVDSLTIERDLLNTAPDAA